MDIPDSRRGEEVRIATADEEHIGMLSEKLHSWPSTKAWGTENLQPYCSYRNEIAIIGDTAMKGIIIIIIVIPTSLQNT